MTSLLAELKRRNVFKVGAAYAIVAWLLIQIVVAVKAPLGLPDWFDTAVIVLIALGFPIALLLAWAFELTPEGIKPTHAVPPGESVTHETSRKLNHVIVALIFGAALGAFSIRIFETGPALTPVPDDAIAQIETAINTGDWESAYSLALQLESAASGNADLAGLWPQFSFLATIPSEPPGAMVYRRPYHSDAPWQPLGLTPLENIRIPWGLSEIRLELDGYDPHYGTLGGGGGAFTGLDPEQQDTSVANVSAYGLKLAAIGSIPEDKIRVPGWTEIINGVGVQFQEYLLDRFEVSNSQYKAFMDAGAYQRQEFWLHPFIRGDATLDFEAAMSLFTDRTGLPGPATWIGGDYPDGEDKHPVAGISWFEANAYARFRGQELPSVYHWRRALAMGTLTWTAPVSNLESEGTLPVGASGAMDWTGAFDLQGNVREWAFNETGGQRYIFGGGWDDTQYTAGSLDTTRSPFDRSPSNGFRLAVTDDPRIDSARAPLELSRIAIDFSAVTPISDDTFAAYQRMFAYDNRQLEASIELEETTRNWTRQLISFDAGYGSERMLVYLYLPLSSSPPYQTVVFWTGAQGVFLDDIEKTTFPLDFLVRNGRAVAFPVFKETFQRGGRGRGALPQRDTAAFRDLNIQWVTELRRSLDYLDSRSDIDSRGYGYVGVSWGSVTAPISLALDERFKAAVVVAGGALREDPLMLQGGESYPEIYPLTYLPRIKAPVLMMNGEYDMIFPLDIAARPFFERIGSPEAIKKLVIFPGGHTVPRAEMISESLTWFDTYLGPVN